LVKIELKKKELLKEENELRLMKIKRLSFFNFVCNCERIIIQNIHLDKNSLLYNLKAFKNYEHIMNLYQRLNDLIIEMIQGTELGNFDHFYKQLPENLTIFDKQNLLNNTSMLDSFIFIRKAIEVQYLLFEQDLFDKIYTQIKINLFTTINNVINQELKDRSFVNILLTIFPPEKLIEILVKYVKGLYINHILKIEYEEENFKENLDSKQFRSEDYRTLAYGFKANCNIYDDEFFKLASLIFLTLIILGEKYDINSVNKFLSYKNQEFQTNSIINSGLNPKNNSNANENKSGFFSKIYSKFNKLMSKKRGYNELNEENHKEDIENENINDNLDSNINNNYDAQENKKDKNEENVATEKYKQKLNDTIVTIKFLSKIIYSCEFMIDSPNDDGDALTLKKIYFIIDPRAYFISKNNIENFFDTVDRTSSTTKIKAMIEMISLFHFEVKYKEKFLEKNKNLKWLLEIEYKKVDRINFCLSLCINIIFMIFLEKGESQNNELMNTLILLLAISTIIINCGYLLCFLFSKYSFYTTMEKSKLENPFEISILDRIRIYFIDSFLLNEETYLMIINIFISIVGSLSRKLTFLFSLQLLTVVKFVPTIKEIVQAFRMRFFQLLSMIGFLGILIFFYSIVGFYFLQDEFLMELDEGKKANICKNLLECWITYFNLGVRSGGGIGDLLHPVAYHAEGFWLRYVTDIVFFVSVVLLLLNMINGVIVSTFGQIREDSNIKEEDINNKCFICNIDRIEFDKRKIDFGKHLKKEHNSKTYIKFFICLGLLHEKDLDADQSYILECIKAKDVYIFPNGRAISFGELKLGEEDEDDKKEEDVVDETENDDEENENDID
jgi:hypothetical protein